MQRARHAAALLPSTLGRCIWPCHYACWGGAGQEDDGAMSECEVNDAVGTRSLVRLHFLMEWARGEVKCLVAGEG